MTVGWAVFACVWVGVSLERANAAAPWVLDYSSYLGGGGYGWTAESGMAIAVDAEGNVIVGGYTDAPDFPATRRWGAAEAERGGFITKWDPTGRRIVFSVTLSEAVVRSLATDPQGNIYAVGEAAYGFSTTNAPQTVLAGDYDAFAVKLDPQGNVLYATLLGGSREDLAWSVAADAQGNAYLTGLTRSSDFPVTANAPQRLLAGQTDAFVATIAPNGSTFALATFLGGTEDDLATCVALDSDGNVYVAGRTQSKTFASGPAAQQLGGGGWQNAFVAKLTAGTASLEYLTLIGSPNSQAAAAALAVDATGHAYVFGNTDATNFPVTAHCWQPASQGSLENFLAKLNPSGSAFDYATYLGGSDRDDATVLKYLGDADVPIDKGGLAIDEQGNAFVAGHTESRDVAPTDLAANAYGGNRDGYVAQIDSTGSSLVRFLYVGGLGEDNTLAIARDAQQGLWLTGVASPSLYPPYFPIVAGAWQSTNNGGSDAFFTRLRVGTVPPANDAFGQRAELSGARASTYADNSAASREVGEPILAPSPTGRTLWWGWLAPADGNLTVDTAGSAFPTLLAVYAGTTLGQLQALGTQAADASNPARVRVGVTAGTEYAIAVDGQEGAAGAIRLNLTLSVPANDNFTNRSRLGGFPATATGSNVDATWEPDDPVGAYSVWWEWTAPVSGTVSITTEGSSFDTVLGVYTNSALAQLGLVGWNDNFTNDTWSSQVNLQATAGTAYQIGVGGGYYQSSGRILVNILPSEPPANDSFTHRLRLTGVQTNLVATNYRATREPAEPNVWYPALPAGRSVWWTWTAPSDGRVTIATSGSDFDTRLAVFIGESLDRLTVVAANDNQGFPYGTEYYASRVNFAAQSNLVYQICVDGDVYEPEGTIHLALHFYHPFTFDTSALNRQRTPGFRLAGQGRSGATYGVEISTNIFLWEAVPDLTLTGPQLQWTDTNAGAFPVRYYRWVERSPGPE